MPLDTISSPPRNNYKQPVFESPSGPPAFLDVDSSFRAHLSPGGATVSFPLPPHLKNQRDKVYAIWIKDDGDIDASYAYAGSTTDTLSSRLSKHASKVNQKKDSALVYKKLRVNPLNIRFGVVNTGLREFKGLDIGDQEKKAVSKIPKHQRLNSNEGGTGGLSLRAAHEAAIKEYGEPPAILPSLVSTPQKRYPLSADEDGAISVAFTPHGKSQQGVIYSIKDQREGMHYAGFTTRTLGERAVEHVGHANRFAKPKIPAKKPNLYEEMQNRPEDFSVGIYASGIIYPKHFVELEKQLIETKDTFDHGYNQNRGGGGCFKRFKKKVARSNLFE
jgi:predicted GIY-YIG superfamily endonuclease